MWPRSTDSLTYEPWFVRSPMLVLVGLVLLFGGVTALRVSLGGDATVGASMLYVLPVGLAGLAWGRGAGIGASGAAIVLIVLWVLVQDVELSAMGWASRVVPLLLVGSLLGDASDRLHRAEEERLAHAAHELQRRQAVEVNDSLLQGMAAAKWALEAGRHEQALTTLDQTLADGQRLVSQLIRDANLGPEAGRRTPG